MRLLLALSLVVLTALPAALRAETYLLMAEQAGCRWCGQWNDEIVHIHPKTPERQTAPLRRYDLLRETTDVECVQSVRFTQTSMLVKNGVEVGRREDYAGEDFFWGSAGNDAEAGEHSLGQ